MFSPLVFFVRIVSKIKPVANYIVNKQLAMFSKVSKLELIIWAIFFGVNAAMIIKSLI